MAYNDWTFGTWVEMALCTMLFLAVIVFAVLWSVRRPDPQEGAVGAGDQEERAEHEPTEAEAWAAMCLAVEQAGHEPFTPAEWRLLERGIRAGAAAERALVRDRS